MKKQKIITTLQKREAISTFNSKINLLKFTFIYSITLVTIALNNLSTLGICYKIIVTNSDVIHKIEVKNTGLINNMMK